LTQQLLALLRTLEVAGDVESLDQFVGSAGHEQLAAWYDAVCEGIVRENPESVEGRVLRELERDLEAAELGDTLRDWLANKGEVAWSVGGFATTAADLAMRGMTGLSLAGVAFACCRSARACRNVSGTSPPTTLARSGHSCTPTAGRLRTTVSPASCVPLGLAVGEQLGGGL
jgi:hypothetical protein